MAQELNVMELLPENEIVETVSEVVPDGKGKLIYTAAVIVGTLAVEHVGKFVFNKIRNKHAEVFQDDFDDEFYEDSSDAELEAK